MINEIESKSFLPALRDKFGHSEKNQKPRKKPSKKKINDTLLVVGTLLCIVMAATCIYLFVGLISAGANALKDSYEASYSAERNETYNDIYNMFYNSAEEKYHVSNRVSITVGNLREQEKLEVLQVSDVEFVIEGKDDNSGNMTSWLEVPGSGTYVVDLAAGEYIIDDIRAHVLVRVPYPELTNIKIDYANVEKLLFKDDIFNGSYKQGEELAMKQLGQADVLIKKEFQSNQGYYLTAQKSARTSIINLVERLNPSVENLTVEVEFY